MLYVNIHFIFLNPDSLWLDVPENETILMAMVHSGYNLVHDIGNVLLCHKLLFVKGVKQICTLKILLNNVNVLAVFVNVYDFDDIGVIEGFNKKCFLNDCLTFLLAQLLL